MPLSSRRIALTIVLLLAGWLGGVATAAEVSPSSTDTITGESQPLRSRRTADWPYPAAADSLTAPGDPEERAGIAPDSIRLTPTELPVPAGERRGETFSPSPRAAVLWAIIPGGGQVYNRKYWKVPLIIGGMTALYYAISWNNNNLLEYAQAYSDIKSSDPIANDSWVAFVPAGADPASYRTQGSFHEMLRHGRDFYRRNRDLSIIIAVGVYALSIVDAYVDAELAHFDISPDLTLHAAPTYIPPTALPTSEGGPALQLALSF